MKNRITPIIKLTENCNFTCSYCRYANKPHEKGMISFDMLTKVIDSCIEYNLLNENFFMHVIFHGGEPLLWGIDNFKNIIEYQKSKSNIRFLNSIQTNGYLINEEWCDLFNIGNFDVGVSIDGPPNINEHGFGMGDTTQRVLGNLELLRAKNCKHGILSVITNKHTSAKEYYDFLVSNNIKSVGLCYQYGDDCCVENDNLTKFLIDLFELYFFGKERIRIREFDGIIEKIIKGKSRVCHLCDRDLCGNYISVRPSGEVMFCDSYDGNYMSIGNINNESIKIILTNNNYLRLIEKSKMFYKEQCVNCNVVHICGAGCFRNDNNKGNYFCPTYKEVYAYIESVIKSFIKERSDK